MSISDLSFFIHEIEWLWPWMIGALPLPYIIRRLLPAAEQRQHPLLAPHIVARLSSHMPQHSYVNTISASRLNSTLLWLLWFGCVAAACRPVWYQTPTPFHVSGKEMMLAVDLSGSMQKEDMYLSGYDVNRLTAVKAVVANFIAQRKGDRMGLVVFGTQAFLQSPLTYDLQTVKALLNETEIGMAGNNTAIGDAIGLTLKHLQKNKQQNAVLILLTDGSNTAGQVDPIEAANQAQKLGLKIYTIAVGRVTHRTGLDLFLQGKSDIDVATLQRIATTTNGQFFQANDTKQLNEIYQYINQLESSEHTIYNYRHRSELYIWPLGFGLIISLLIAMRLVYRQGRH